MKEDSKLSKEEDSLGLEDKEEQVQVLDSLPKLLEIEQNSSKSDVKDLVRYDPLKRYLSEIRHIKPLSAEKERDLAILYKEKGDRMAGYQLVMANLRLVVMIAREYQKNAKNVLDLVQEGNLGLLEAVKQFDPYRGIRFPSYAVYWVRAYMLRYIINNLRLVKIGTTQAQRKLFFNLNKEKAKLEAEGFSPEAKLLAERLNVKESEVIEMEQRLELPDLSVDAPVSSGGSDRDSQNSDMHGILPDKTSSIEDDFINSEFSEVVRSSVKEFKSGLDSKQKAILERRLFTNEPETLQSIADEFSLSRERIRQIESKLKVDLKKHLSKNLKLDDDGEVLL